MYKNKLLQYPLLVLSVCLLGACSQDHSDLREWIKDTQRHSKNSISPFTAPEILPPKPYIPPPHQGLDAFDSRRLTDGQQVGNLPELNRPREILEQFDLDTLHYVGSLRNGNKISGYIKAGDAHVYTVTIGNRLGKNFGRITQITTEKIILAEIAEDANGNWITKKAELPLYTEGDNNSSNNSSLPTNNTALTGQTPPAPQNTAVSAATFN